MKMKYITSRLSNKITIKNHSSDDNIISEKEFNSVSYSWH